jgi:hypothetical protein
VLVVVPTWATVAWVGVLAAVAQPLQRLLLETTVLAVAVDRPMSRALMDWTESS